MNPISPDCREGKYRACTGDAWNLQADESADCTCSCHDGGTSDD